MKFREITKRNGEVRYLVDALPVSREEYFRLLEAERNTLPKVALEADLRRTGGDWTEPVVSVALAVHPKQMVEERTRLEKAGVPTDFTPDGAPILRSKAHKAAVMRYLGYHDRNSFS